MKNEKIKIVYLITGLGSGGAEMMLYRLLERIDRRQYDPTVVGLLNLEWPLKTKIEALNIPVYSCGFRSKFNLLPVFRLYKIIKHEAPVILHTQLFAADILGRLVGAVSKVPIIITSIRNIKYGSKMRDLLIKYTEKYADRTTIVSAIAAQRFIGEGIIPAAKLEVIHSGIDPSKFISRLENKEKQALRDEIGLPAEQTVIINVASLTEKKGHKYLLKAVKELLAKGLSFSLVIVGSGELEEPLKRKVEEYGLAGSVYFLGRRDDVPLLLASADLFVLSSLWEGLPGVVLEAMASELPVISTNVGGVPELIEDGVNGYLVSPCDSLALADALEKLILNTADTREKMGQEGKKRVYEKFNVTAMVNAYEKLYSDCLVEKNIID